MQQAAATASGKGCKRSVTSVITPSVPSAPTKSRVRSQPAALDLRAAVPVLDDASVGKHHGQSHYIFSHHTRNGLRSFPEARVGGHSPDRRIGPWIDKKGKASVLQSFIQAVLRGIPCFHPGRLQIPVD